MVYVRHRTASGRLDEFWEYDPVERAITVLARVASVSIPFRVLLCSFSTPELGAHPINRVDAETWRVLPQRFVRMWPHGIETLRAIDCPIVADLGPGRTLTLTNTPADVSAALEAL